MENLQKHDGKKYIVFNNQGDIRKIVEGALFSSTNFQCIDKQNSIWKLNVIFI